MRAILRAYAVLFLYAIAGAEDNVDLSELVFLAGDTDSTVDLKDTTLSTLGWKRGVEITFNLIPGYSHDKAMTFIKGDHCLATWQSVSDIMDTQAVVVGLQSQPPAAMCNHSVHAGVAKEMSDFMNTSQFGDFVAFLNNATCKTVTAVGQSFGGALATLWATCANLGAEPALFGARTDYQLVTFTALAMAKTPPYNGKPGVPFVGTRYGIVETSETAARQKEANSFLVNAWDQAKDFRLKILEGFAVTFNSMNLTGPADHFTMIRQQMSGMTTEQVEEWWAANVNPPSTSGIHEFALLFFANAGQDNPTGRWLAETLPQLAASGVLTHEVDGVGALGQMFGYKHALQVFQPMTNRMFPGNTDEWSLLPAVPPSAAVDEPKADVYQFTFSTLANNGGFVNHDTCCYTSAHRLRCAASFTEPKWRSCKNPFIDFRGEPWEPPPPPLKCGEIKKAYKKGCCKKSPETVFKMDRRLGTAVSQPQDDEALLTSVKEALQRAESSGGKLAAHILAQQISAVIPKDVSGQGIGQAKLFESKQAKLLESSIMNNFLKTHS
mmetsp:Transcript_89508/g.157951  ORF Transcript_89508/g.157951 Transcript_89508/m.157951 type:complete len:552 (+) Transcript_89508:59-1714(+)